MFKYSDSQLRGKSTKFQNVIYAKSKEISIISEEDITLHTIFLLGKMKEGAVPQKIAEKYISMIKEDEEIFGRGTGVLIFYGKVYLLILEAGEEYKHNFFVTLREELKISIEFDKNIKILAILPSYEERLLQSFTWLVNPNRKLYMALDDQHATTLESSFVNVLILCRKVLENLKGVEDVESEIGKVLMDTPELLPKETELVTIEEEIPYLLSLDEYVKTFLEKGFQYITDDETVWPAPKHRFI